AAAYSWSFQTANPKVTATYPTNSGPVFFSKAAGTANPNALPPLSGPVTEISPWTPIEVTFSEPMDPTTINATTLVLLNSSGGTARTNTNTFAGTSDQALYQFERVGMSAYTLQVPAGIYDVKLFFAETEFNAPNQRVFNVDIPETTASPDLHMDIYNEVGANTADVKTISGITTAAGPGTSGYIHINFTAIVGQPVISAIKLTPIRPAV